MFAFRQIIDDPGEFIPVPVELRHRRTEVIFVPMDQEPPPTTAGKDEGIRAFFGSIPDFPDREPQGEYETRLEIS